MARFRLPILASYQNRRGLGRYPERSSWMRLSIGTEIIQSKSHFCNNGTELSLIEIGINLLSKMGRDPSSVHRHVLSTTLPTMRWGRLLCHTDMHIQRCPSPPCGNPSVYRASPQHGALSSHHDQSCLRCPVTSQAFKDSVVGDLDRQSNLEVYYSQTEMSSRIEQ